MNGLLFLTLIFPIPYEPEVRAVFWPRANSGIEMTAPSYGHAVFYSDTIRKPREFKGYRWFREDVGAIFPRYNWALYRMRDAPETDDEVLRMLPKDLGIWDQDDPRTHLPVLEKRRKS